jgi:microsomal dipeptidase-like Zn-dependent dipeptidase
MCTVYPQTIAEPTTGRTAAQTPGCPVNGYADNHIHMFAHLGQGGGVLAGQPYDAVNGINGALTEDFGTNMPVEEWDETQLPTPACPSYMGSCGALIFHQGHDALEGDVVGNATNDQAAGASLGVPVFSGWPQWNSTSHQQAYYLWLQRAWQGGLRLMTMLGVTNEALCRGNKRLTNYPNGYPGGLGMESEGTGCFNSMTSIDQQIQAANDFQAFVDDQNGGAGKGWFRIVMSPEDARTQIAAGNLAVVLGIEVDNIFGCKNPLSGGTTCSTSDMQTAVDKYYAEGVRHIFPIHNFDNGFGAAAAWYDSIEVGQRAVEGFWWNTSECAPAGYGFKLSSGFDQFLALIARFPDDLNNPPYPVRPETASCNSNGLTDLGKSFVSYLMQKGMIIDVDHMSVNSFNDTLTLAEQQHYPVVATHVLAFDLHQQFDRHERMRTYAQLQRIRNVGGMVSAMLKDDVQDTEAGGTRVTIPYANSTVPDDCRHSSKSFIQELDYLTDAMGGQPVSFGSDFNGIAAHVGPRFGRYGCGSNLIIPFSVSSDPTTLAERSLQYLAGNQLHYPFTLPGFGTFDKQITGDKTFDFNVDGLAHIGLLPDLVAELGNLTARPDFPYVLDRSAEAYIRVWERASGAVPQPGVPSCTQIGITTPDQGPPYLAGAPIVFQAAVSEPLDNQTLLTYKWDFGDGGSFTVTGPTPVYDINTGTVGVQATHTFANGNATPYSVTLRVTGPQMAFGATSLPITITAQDANSTRLTYVMPPSASVGVPAIFTFTVTPDSIIDNAVCVSGDWTGAANNSAPIDLGGGTDLTGPYERYQVSCTIGAGLWDIFDHQNPNVFIKVHTPGGLFASTAATYPANVLNFIPPAPTAAPTITVIPDVTTTATAAYGAVVVWGYFNQVTAVDSNGPEPIACTPGPGYFPLGVNIVSCTASNAAGTSVKTFKITVQSSAPVLTVPSDITVQAPSASGAVVFFVATASDLNGSLPVSCSPPSDSLFPIGATRVICNTSNASGDTQSFFNVIVTPAAQAASLQHPTTTPTLGDGTFTETAQATSGLPVTVVSTTPAVCTVGSNNSGAAGGSVAVTIVTAGTCALSGTQGGNGFYTSAPPASDTVTVNKFTIPACAPSGCGVAGGGSPNPGGSIAIVSGASATPGAAITALVNIAPSQVAGLLLFQNTILINSIPQPVTTQIFVFLTQVDSSGNPIGAPTLAGTGLLQPTGNEYQAVVQGAIPAAPPSGTYQAFVYGDDAVARTNGVLAADAGYLCPTFACTDPVDFIYPTLVSGTLQVANSASVTFTGAPASAAYGSSFTVSATTNASTTPVITATGACAIAGNVVTMTSGTGTCQMTAAWAADANYPAASATQTTSALTATPTVTFTGAPASAANGASFTVSATTNASTAAVITAAGACSIAGHTVTMTSGTGTCQLTATWAADSNYSAASATQTTATQLLTQTIAFAPLPSQTFGAPPFVVGATASSGLPVSFASTTPAVCTVSSATVTLAGAGTCTIQATQTGSSTYAAAPAVNRSFLVFKAATATALSSGLNPSTYSQSITFTAVVSASGVTPAGQVVFKNGASAIGTATLSGGVATLTYATLPAGADSITAAYSGNAQLMISSSTALSQTVLPAATTTALTSSPNPSAPGQSVTFRATVKPVGAAPIRNGETLTFYDGAANIGTATTAAGVAVFSTTSLAAGPHSITAAYGGDGNYKPSTSPVVNQIVSRDATTTTLSSSLNPSTYGQTVTFTARVSSSGVTPTGTVQFKNGTSSIGSSILSGGVAMLTTTSLPAGTDSITAAYGGDPSSSGSTSGPVSQSVAQAATATTVASSKNPSNHAQSVTFTATVTSAYATPVGAVTFTQGATTLGTANLVNGKANLAVTTLPSGSDTVTATYAGNANFHGSSGTIVQTVH